MASPLNIRISSSQIANGLRKLYAHWTIIDESIDTIEMFDGLQLYGPNQYNDGITVLRNVTVYGIMGRIGNKITIDISTPNNKAIVIVSIMSDTDYLPTYIAIEDDLYWVVGTTNHGDPRLTYGDKDQIAESIGKWVNHPRT